LDREVLLAVEQKLVVVALVLVDASPAAGMYQSLVSFHVSTLESFGITLYEYCQRLVSRGGFSREA
jgi:hypothetical protein